MNYVRVFAQLALAACMAFFGIAFAGAPSPKGSLVVTTPTKCLAANIYHEARGESLAGQYAVAMVTLNRAEQQKKNVCKVVFQPKQFSWTNKLVKKVKAGWKLPQRLRPVDTAAWKLANQIAVKALAGKLKDITNGSKFYHTASVSPSWNKSMKLAKTIGHHKFFVQVASN